MPTDTTLLARVPLFERFDDEERALLAGQLEEVSFSPGGFVFRRGDPGDSIYIVAEGEVEIFLDDSLGERIVFETVKAGDFFGELSLLDGEPRSASAQALEATKALKVDRNDLALLFSRHPNAAMDVMAIIGRRLRVADRLLGVRANRASPNQLVEERVTRVQRVADAAAEFSGTFKFLLIHAVWFAVWILANLNLVSAEPAFDPYPFGLLTMLVSLEAIFLSCMVLISQSRQAVKDRIRSDAEYEANIRASLEVTQLHVKLDNVFEQLAQRVTQMERTMGQKPAPPPD